MKSCYLAFVVALFAFSESDAKSSGGIVRVEKPKVTACAGGKVRLKCQVPESYTAKWYTQAAPNGTLQEVKSHKGRFSTDLHTMGDGRQLPGLNIQNVTKDDQKVKYWCEAAKGSNKKKEQVTLKVIDCPEEITFTMTTDQKNVSKTVNLTSLVSGGFDRLMDEYVPEGEKVTVSCSVHAPDSKTPLASGTPGSNPGINEYCNVSYKGVDYFVSIYTGKITR